MTGSGALDGKVVLVTGGGHGIGRLEIALLAAREGASVVVNDLGSTPRGDGQDAGAASEVVSLIERNGGKAAANGGDVSSFADARAMVQQAVDTFGRIDAIASIAGISRDAAFHKMTEHDFDRVVQVNLKEDLQRRPGRRRLLPAADVGRNAAHDVDRGPDRLSRHGQLRRRQDGNLSASPHHRPRHGALQRALELPRTACLEPHVRADGGAHAGRAEARGAPEGDECRQDGPALHLSSFRPGCRHYRPGVRRWQNELYLYNQPRQVRSVHREAGWSVQDIHQHAMPAMRQFLTSLDELVSGDRVGPDMSGGPAEQPIAIPGRRKKRCR